MMPKRKLKYGEQFTTKSDHTVLWGDCLPKNLPMAWKLSQPLKRPEILIPRVTDEGGWSLNLQRAVQSAIDLAAHIVSDEGLGLPDDLKTNFVLLQKSKIIDKSLSNKLKKMVGFRNIAIHDYSAIDVNVLKSILKNNLNDLEEFYSVILKYFKLS